MTDCLFCKIVDGSIPADVVYEGTDVVVFRDISPKAPHHLLVIPKIHLSNVLGLTREHATLLVHLFEAIHHVVTLLGIDQSGFRVVANTGLHGGQTVDHLHFHLLAGRALQWPPG